ncbi:RidA family protein [Phyllobacterium myrsinacearum]|uniref:Reactive intermediate/imine deaminase n=1 Tax=Phyllobacterium myrsinacearum TaxID=28101 RepID=A0A2S9JP61_9HYPH|nr:RidA family protein [Phyllobacterium myrsinacearum]PRD55023.1 reactive intermediate/imine deaminase [Phyllobacterium myrsinacearum]PWV90425.1 reactive intermediate/imine deaminase [Phyllobacterium myrsinacearum]RZS79823.1 reactive intermediate/imine deaminase [Phyllobacterium myrsinacearum]RZV05381.1 reactive intermediate/imine deaminase [Phyllobacterium myrsinacearum]
MTKIYHHVPDAAPSPKSARYSHAVEACGFLYVTGQLPVDPDAPDLPLAEGIVAQTEMSFLNLEKILKGCRYDFSDTIFVRIYLADFNRDYTAFNSVYHRYFNDDTRMPGRTTVGVAALGRGALVEIDMVLHRGG